MRSSNPVFSRNPEFNGQPGTYIGSSAMTLDTVVEKSAITLAVVIASAAFSWFFLVGPIVDDAGMVDSTAVMRAGLIATLGAFVGFGLAMVNSFKKIISPALVIAYAVVEGMFVGAFSKIVAVWVGDTAIVGEAVFATMIAFAVTLGAYKFFNIKVTPKFRRVVLIALVSFVGVMLLNLVGVLLASVFPSSVFSMFSSGGLSGFNMLGLVVSVIAVGLAALMLILDFDYIEQGVAAGLPERESWRAAFGLTVTLIWMYLELLRILAILRN